MPPLFGSPTLTLIVSMVVFTAVGWVLARVMRPSDAREDRLRKHPRGMEEKDPYSLRKSLLTAAETGLFRVLMEVAPTGCVVLAKVRLSELLNVTYGAGDRAQAHGRVSAKGLDFVVCDATLRPLAAILLVDGTVDRDHMRSREFMSRVLVKAGLPLVELPVKPGYDAGEVRAVLAPHLPATA